MKRIGMKYLEPGMVIARKIYRADGKVILGEGVTLTPEYIKKLPGYGITSIYVKDERTNEIVIEDLISDNIRISGLSECKSINDTLKEIYLKKNNKSIREDTILTMLDDVGYRLNNLSKMLVEDFLNVKGSLLNFIDTRIQEDYIYSHMLNVTVISILIGRTLGYKYDKLVDLAKGCLVHDIGIIIGVPDEIRNKPGNLDAEEMAIVKKHPEAAFELLRKIRTFNITSAHISYQHHERYNGSGYPRGLKGNEIIEYGAIVAVADVFDAITNNKVYKLRVLPDKAREFLMAAEGTFFAPYIVEAFLSRIPAYPVGTSVILTNGCSGVVARQNENLNRPIIKILNDSGIEHETGYELDLLENNSVLISKIMD